MKSKHINWTQGLKCDHRVWPWPWPSPWIFKVTHGICYISAKNGRIATKRKTNILIELEASNVTIGFDLGHDLDLEFMEFAISQPKVVRRSGVRVYHIVTGVTSDVGMPSTDLVMVENVYWSNFIRVKNEIVSSSVLQIWAIMKQNSGTKTYDWNINYIPGLSVCQMIKPKYIRHQYSSISIQGNEGIHVKFLELVAFMLGISMASN